MSSGGVERAVAEALRVLGIRNLVAGIHDPAFPGLAGNDISRGSPYSRGAEAWLGFVRSLGFTGVQLGPQGQTSDNNPSPYDGTISSRNVLSIALRQLTEPREGSPLLAAETLAALAEGVPGHCRSTGCRMPMPSPRKARRFARRSRGSNGYDLAT